MLLFIYGFKKALLKKSLAYTGSKLVEKRVPLFELVPKLLFLSKDQL